MERNGYIRLHRKFIGWEWYTDINTKVVFLHLLLLANWKDGRFQGVDVPRGSLITSIGKLSAETGLSENKVRTALNHLEKTGEIHKQITNRFSLISVQNYDLYQDESQANHNQTTSNPQANHNQITTNEKEEKEKEGKESKNISAAAENPPTAPAAFSIPLIDGSEFQIYDNDIKEWEDAFPAVDVRQELKRYRLWTKDNPTKRKTRRGIRKSITTWLGRTQDRGGTRQMRIEDDAKDW